MPTKGKLNNEKVLNLISLKLGALLNNARLWVVIFRILVAFPQSHKTAAQLQAPHSSHKYLKISRNNSGFLLINLFLSG